MPCVSALIMKIYTMCVVGADLCVCPHQENLYPIKKMENLLMMEKGKYSNVGKGQIFNDGKGANIQ